MVQMPHKHARQRKHIRKSAVGESTRGFVDFPVDLRRVEVVYLHGIQVAELTQLPGGPKVKQHHLMTLGRAKLWARCGWPGQANQHIAIAEVAVLDARSPQRHHRLQTL